MITNFDSTEQSQEWNDLVKQYPAYPSIRNLWCRTDTYRPCERLLNDYTDIATHFAGIVRTAYMYCPKIMLTEAQLLDGLFFLALGPTAVNGVLGKSYKDGRRSSSPAGIRLWRTAWWRSPLRASKT